MIGRIQLGNVKCNRAFMKLRNKCRIVCEKRRFCCPLNQECKSDISFLDFRDRCIIFSVGAGNKYIGPVFKRIIIFNKIF